MAQTSEEWIQRALAGNQPLSVQERADRCESAERIISHFANYMGANIQP